jgi:hypothetical protein
MGILLPLPVLGSYFNWHDQSKRTDPATGQVQLLAPNPQRWAVMFWFVSGTTVTVSPFPDMGAAGGFPLNQSPFVFVLTFEQLGGMIQGCWFGLTNPTNQFIGVTEVVYMPPSDIGVSQAGGE